MTFCFREYKLKFLLNKTGFTALSPIVFPVICQLCTAVFSLPDGSQVLIRQNIKSDNNYVPLPGSRWLCQADTILCVSNGLAQQEKPIHTLSKFACLNSSFIDNSSKLAPFHSVSLDRSFSSPI